MRDFETAKLLVDLKVVVDNPITGEKPLTYLIELSRMDVERGFIEAQDKDAALQAIITGSTKGMEDANELVRTTTRARILRLAAAATTRAQACD